MHQVPMRRLAPALILLLAACATTPQQPQAPQVSNTAPAPVIQRPSSAIIGLTAAELVSRLGNPQLQVREGSSLKLQFRTQYCVLDAFLYPPDSGQGLTRVTYSNARLPSGIDTDQAACISAIEAAR
jgi:hypothetical protein